MFSSYRHSVSSFFLLFLFSLLVNSAYAAVIEVPIAAQRDDVEESTGSNNGRVIRNSNDLELVYAGRRQGNQEVGLRFLNVTVPQGATINSAYIEFTSDESRTSSSTVTVFGEDIGNAPQFIGGYGSFNVSSRTKTGGVPWVPGDWSTVGSKHQTPDLSSIVSSIVGRADWSSGNAMVFIITGSGRVAADSYSAGGTKVPKLVIDYSEGPAVIGLNKTQLNPTALSGTDASADTFTITNTGGSTLNYTLSDDAAWLQLSPTNGALTAGQSQIVDVTYVGTGALADGNYSATITAQDPAAVPTTQTIAVALILGVGEPHIVLTHSLPDPIIMPVDYANSDYTFTIGNTGGNSLNYTITDVDDATSADASWMTFTPLSGTVSPSGAEQTVTINLSTTGLTEGETYTGTITVSDPNADNDPQTIPITLSIVNRAEFTPGSSSDDAEQRKSNGYMYLNSSDLEMIADWSNLQDIGIRFNNLSIPSGSLIHNAYIRFMADGNTSGEVDLQIYGENIGNAQTFSSSNTVTGRSLTDAMSEWKDIPSWSRNSLYNSPNLAPIVQEIVTHDGWQFGNSMAFIIKGEQGRRRAHSYDQFANNSYYKPPTLVIEWVETEQPFIKVTPSSELGAVAIEGANAADQTFTLKNTGAGDLNYTIQISDTWLSTSHTSGTLVPQASQEITVSFYTNSMAIGNYTTTITISDPNAFNSPYEYVVNLEVMELQAGSGCGEVPIYAQNIINPAILVQLDTSGSMRSYTNTGGASTKPRTPNLRNIFLSMLNDPTWTPNVSDIVFFITGSGNRTAISYDGSSSEAPTLNIEHYPPDDPSTPDVDESATLVTYSKQVSQSSDDAEERASTGSVGFTSTDLEMVTDGSNSQIVGMRFQDINIDPGSAISDVYITFAKNVTTTTPTSLTIEGEDVSAAGNSYQAETFDDTANNLSSRTKLANVVNWNFIDTWWGDVRMPRYQVGRAVIADLVADRTISWGFGTWDSVNAGPQWWGSGSGPDTSQLPPNDYSKTSPYYLETPYYDQYGTDDSSRWDLFTMIKAGVKSRDANETVALQNVIIGTGTGSGTPLGPSMLAARAYFKEQKSDEDGDKYNSALTCQPKFLINITDGQGYLNHTTTDYMGRYAHWLADDEITAVTIGFDLSNSSQIDIVAQVSNERGAESTTDHLYSLHVDRDGDGDVDSFAAASGEELTQALAEITDSVKKELFYGSAPAPSTSVDMGSFVIIATFNPENNWVGDLKALPYDPITGQIEVPDTMLPNPPSDCASANSTCWRAGYLLPENGWLDYDKAFTVAGSLTNPSGDGTGNAISYTDSSLGNDNYICKGLGDIIKSTPKIIDVPKKFHSFDNYVIFETDSDVTSRPPLVSIGANDGALHFFNLETGVESHRFYPLGAHGTLDMAASDPTYDTCSDEYCHQYMVDGSPIAEDIFTGTEVRSGSTITDPGWRTVVITGLGRGGDSYFAIDTTYNNSFDATVNPSKYLWNYTDSELGLAIANPYITRVYAPARDTDGVLVTNGGFGGWAVYFGSGYSKTSQVTKESYLLGLKAWDKGQLWSSGERVKIESDDTIDYNTLTVDFSTGETITGQTSNVSAEIVALTKTGTSGTLKLENITGTFVDGEDIIDSSGGTAKVWGTIHSSYRNDALNSPVAADIDFNFISEYIYTGTLHGRMHRISQIGLNESPSVSCIFDFGENHINYTGLTTSFTAGQTLTGQTSGATGKIVYIEENADGTGTLYLVGLAGPSFQSGESLQGGGGGSATANGVVFRADQPIRGTAEWAFAEDENTAWLYFGTGRFETQLDKTTTDQNFFVGMKDYLDTSTLDPVDETYLSDLVGNEIVTVSDDTTTTTIDESLFRNVTGSNSGKAPWYIKLMTSGYSERVITKPLVVGGLVFFQTFTPDNDPCAGNGSFWLYVVDYETGLPPTETVFDINGDRKFDDADLVDLDGDGDADDVVVGVYLGRGVPTGLVLEKNILFAGTSDGAAGGGGGGFGGGGGRPINPMRTKADLESWRDRSL